MEWLLTTFDFMTSYSDNISVFFVKKVTKRLCTITTIFCFNIILVIHCINVFFNYNIVFCIDDRVKELLMSSI